jgi:homoserine kinase type II
MAVYTVLDPEQLAAALAPFGLPPPSQIRPEPRGAVNTGYHVWSGGHRFFLRLNEGKSEADARFEAEAQRYLHAAQFPVPELRSTLDGRSWIEVAGKPTMLFAYAPGEVLAPGDVMPDRCRRVGEQMGRLHELSAGFSAGRPNPYGRTWVAARMNELASAPATDPEASAALPMFQEELARSARLPGAPRGLIHGDLFVDNVLWIGDRVSALLDWEMSCVDPFAYDLGVALNAWCWAGGYLADRGRALLSGYRSRRKVEPETASAVYDWSRFAALRFAVARLIGYVPAGASAAPPAGKDWREYRDRLIALRSTSETEFAALLAL